MRHKYYKLVKSRLKYMESNTDKSRVNRYITKHFSRETIFQTGNNWALSLIQK